jgi:hypothetical protein
MFQKSIEGACISARTLARTTAVGLLAIGLATASVSAAPPQLARAQTSDVITEPTRTPIFEANPEPPASPELTVDEVVINAFVKLAKELQQLLTTVKQTIAGTEGAIAELKMRAEGLLSDDKVIGDEMLQKQVQEVIDATKTCADKIKFAKDKYTEAVTKNTKSLDGYAAALKATGAERKEKFDQAYKDADEAAKAALAAVEAQQAADKCVKDAASKLKAVEDILKGPPNLIRVVEGVTVTQSVSGLPALELTVP